MADLHCALCGRSMASATVYIGQLPVGPTCARRAGLVEAARKRRGALRLQLLPRTPAAQRDSRTLDLFEETACA
ncbi:hypothetical protein [Pulveribacter sp.]|uniref:hypothetical protein n=1 Tax=Pulveribacter sp. TaxID=2678893 RepID=UPI0028AA949E|nr:hypothetical protein [Pulveribacter sp.]